VSAQQVAADLRAAAEVLRRDGWSRWHFERSDGAHCAAGALHRVAPNSGAGMARRLAAHRAFSRCTGHGVVQFNDYIAKDADEVIAALEAAADAAEAQQ
jgi:hypothetical protein